MSVHQFVVLRTFVLVASLTVLLFGNTQALAKKKNKPRKVPVTAVSNYKFVERTSPSRRDVYNRAGKWIATLTYQSHTVTMIGPERIFSEQTVEDPVIRSVTHSKWVRMLAKPFTGVVDKSWLDHALAQNERGEPDVLAVAMQYRQGTRPLYVGQLQVAGYAMYGPLLDAGLRQEGSDFQDYLGVGWNFPDLSLLADPNQFRSLDCSGYLRMIFGYRFGVPLSYNIVAGYMPRKSHQIYSGAPGILLIQNTGVQAADLASLNPGDILFWDSSTNDGTQIDHSGIFLGIDADGNYRFISSRKSINGPTMGNYKGASIINATGIYSTSFRAARRL